MKYKEKQQQQSTMATSNYIKYGDLEVRVEASVDKDGHGVSETLRRLDFQKNGKIHSIPTEDEEVKSILGLLNEPATIIGEDPFSRRERLSDLVMVNEENMYKFTEIMRNREIEQPASSNHADSEGEDEEFYTPASPELIAARKFLIGYSFDRSRERLRKEKQNVATFDVAKELNERRNFSKEMHSMELIGVQVVSSRPISQAKLSPNEAYILTAGWAGSVGILDSTSLEVLNTVDNAHIGKIGGVDWNSSGDFIVTGAEDGLVKAFANENGQLLEKAVFTGHERRVAGTKFHPSGRYIASASFDMTWRLWDVETSQELLLQEGHDREVYSLAFQCDGSLLCSAGLDSTGMVWDIRSGKCVVVLSGHEKPIYSVDWSPNGHHIATGAGDGVIKIWDMRKPNEDYTVLAHNSIVTNVCFEKSHGKCLVSSSYDKAIKVYSSENWINIRTLEGHTDKVLSVDISRDADAIISAGWDRSVKLWKLNK